MKTLNFLLVACLLTFGLSCKKSEFPTEEIILKTKPLEISKLKAIADDLKDREASISNGTNQEGTVRRLTQFNDIEFHSILEPLIINGRELQTELVSFISNTNEWQQLSESDQFAIINMSDEQLADLAFTYGAVTHGIKDCVSLALGIAGIQHLAQSLVTGPSVSSAIGVLKWVGKRYLSYIGVAWMIWDFVDCMSIFG